MELVENINNIDINYYKMIDNKDMYFKDKKYGKKWKHFFEIMELIFKEIEEKWQKYWDNNNTFNSSIVGRRKLM